ncbi:MAG: 2-oxoacid:acceptor oxidoreductase subunit alpha [Kiritimatiellia bacterium]
MTIRDEINICIGGEAGQGLITLGDLLSRSLVRCGYHIVVTQEYMSRIRGGHNTYAIRAGSGRILAPRESIDLLVAFNKETGVLHRGFLSPFALIVAAAADCETSGLYLPVPYTDFDGGKFENMAALGVVAAMLGLDEAIVTETVRQSIGNKSGLLDRNMASLSAGWTWAARQEAARGRFSLPAAKEHPKRIMLNGNDAIALGALSAGLKFCSFYPMTPATSIPQMLAKYGNDFNLVVEQAEDEIAAINMAIGASFCGARSMVATSGGGFALMAEGVSLAGMTETPVVIVVGQRPGPATGLPTRTEQADLDFILHAGHGEFPRAVFAPGSVEECFRITREAFAVAGRFQGPVFILTDQFLADSYRAVLPFKLSEETFQEGVVEIFSGPTYRRFAFSDTGVSLRLLPGMSEHLVVADSDEHTEDGHITEDLGIRKMMVEKRQNKLQGIVSRVLPPEYEGDDAPDLLMVSWGSSKDAVREAALLKKAEGVKVGTLHFRQVWPLVPGLFMPYLESAGKAVCVEGNHGGQFARLIRRECGFEIPFHVRRYDGLPFTPEYILGNLHYD